MRMVSNKHVTGQSMKRFKRIHIQHKPVLRVVDKVADIVINEIEMEKPVDEEIAEQFAPEESDVEVKPKTRRKKKTEDAVINNEEKSEENG